MIIGGVTHPTSLYRVSDNVSDKKSIYRRKSFGFNSSDDAGLFPPPPLEATCASSQVAFFLQKSCSLG